MRPIVPSKRVKFGDPRLNSSRELPRDLLFAITPEMDWSHSPQTSLDSITQQVLTWNPEGKRKRGRPRNTWRRDLEAGVKETGYTWRPLER